MPVILRLKIRLPKFIKNDHFYTNNKNSMTQSYIAGTIYPRKWRELTLFHNNLETKKGDKSP